jgi:branched-chain amino acid transport system permease protein
MNISFFISILLSGLAWSAILFMIASGLSLVFGIMNVINFAHATFYMLASYFLVTFLYKFGFLTSILLSILLVTFFAIILEFLLFRPLYNRTTEYQLLLTFGLVIAFEDIIKIIWGSSPHAINAPDILDGSINILNLPFPKYQIFVIIFSIILAFSLWWIIENTKFGRIIRAASTNNEMTQSVGINIKLVYSGVFALGAVLAALGGCIALPFYSIYPTMGTNLIVTALIVVVIGHMKSLEGAILGSVIIGVLETILIFYFPFTGMVMMYVLAAIILIIKPKGLLGDKL